MVCNWRDPLSPLDFFSFFKKKQPWLLLFKLVASRAGKYTHGLWCSQTVMLHVMCGLGDIFSILQPIIMYVLRPFRSQFLQGRGYDYIIPVIFDWVKCIFTALLKSHCSATERHTHLSFIEDNVLWNYLISINLGKPLSLTSMDREIQSPHCSKSLRRET